MEKKKIYKWAKGKDAIELLKKEGGVDMCYCEDNYEIFYMPYNGGLIENTDIGSPVGDYIESCGIEVKKQEILDDDERKYLSNVCKPFLNNIKCIMKVPFGIEQEFIVIKLNDGYEFYLPPFEANIMYKEMILGKEYTIQELKMK